MGTILLAAFKKFGGWIIGIGGAVLAIWYALSSAKRVGKAEAEATAAVNAAAERVKTNEAVSTRLINEERAANEARVEATKGAANVEAEVNRLDSGAIANRLRDEWTRKDTE